MARSDKKTQPNVVTNCNLPVQPAQRNEKPKKSPAAARRRYLARLREEYANALFSKFLNDYPGTLTMKFSKGAWRLSFSWGHEKVQAQGKTLAHALINLAAKSPLTPEGGMQPSEQNSTESKSSLSFGEGWGEEFKSVAL